MKRIFICLTIVFSSCSKPLLVSHLHADEYWEVKKDRKQFRKIGSYGANKHGILSPVICWNGLCISNRERTKSLGPKFNGYKFGGLPLKFYAPEDTTNQFEEVVVRFEEEVALVEEIEFFENEENSITEINSLGPFSTDIIYRFTDLKFGLNLSSIPEESKEELASVITFLTNNPSLRINISGHTDDSGNKDQNLILSEERAKSIKNYIVSKGIAAGRIDNHGWGSQIPIAPNNTEAGRKKNRRVEFNFYK
jgi:outer membrane protein OmpA-like peptidoglycan-associated protein